MTSSVEALPKGIEHICIIPPFRSIPEYYAAVVAEQRDEGELKHAALEFDDGPELRFFDFMAAGKEALGRCRRRRKKRSDGVKGFADELATMCKGYAHGFGGYQSWYGPEVARWVADLVGIETTHTRMRVKFVRQLLEDQRARATGNFRRVPLREAEAVVKAWKETWRQPHTIADAA